MSTAVPFAQYAIQPILHGLKTVTHVISKGEAHAKAQGIDPSEFTTASIHPDMKDFAYQVYRFTDSAKFIPWRVNPENTNLSLPDIEKTFPELLARIQKVTEYLESIDEKTFEGKEMSEVIMAYPHRGIRLRYTAAEYVMTYAHPNFWFHVTTAYDILRMKGVDIGKTDFLNGSGSKHVETIEKVEKP